MSLTTLPLWFWFLEVKQGGLRQVVAANILHCAEGLRLEPFDPEKPNAQSELRN